jgi:hypothetical protein
MFTCRADAGRRLAVTSIRAVNVERIARVVIREGLLRGISGT